MFIRPRIRLANIIRETSSNGGSPYNLLIDLARLQAPFPLGAAGLVGDDLAERALEFPPAPSLSLLVVFDYLGRPHMRLIWITSGVPQSLTLPQQIPALI